jgi:hypothetical protein
MGIIIIFIIIDSPAILFSPDRLLHFLTLYTPLLSSGQSSLATDPEARVRSPPLSEEKVVGLERGPLSLVSITEALLDRKVATPV